jgi:hypothetical protein
LITYIYQRIHNTCLKFVYGVRKFDHLTPLFQASGWLNIEQRYNVHLCCLVRKILQLNIPAYLQACLYYNQELHSISSSSTRFHSSLAFPRYRTTKFQVIFLYIAVKYLNLLPDDVRACLSFSPFKAAAFQHIISHF